MVVLILHGQVAACCRDGVGNTAPTWQHDWDTLLHELRSGAELTEHLKGLQQRLEELLAVDHISRQHHIRRLPLLRQLARLCDAPCELKGNGCSTR